MEKKHNSGLDACEKFFKSIHVNSPFRAIRHISFHPQDSMPPNPSPSASAHHLKTHKNKEAAEVVHIEFVNSSWAHEKAKHAHVNGQLTNVAPNSEPMLQIAQLKTGKTKPNAEVTELGDNVFRKGEIEPHLHVSSTQQKLKPRADKTSPAQVAGHGRQGSKTNGKVEPPQVSWSESNNLGENMEDAFTDYINRAKMKIRTTSSVNGNRVGDGSKSTASGTDDSEDEFSDYINHAKMKMLRNMTGFTP